MSALCPQGTDCSDCGARGDNCPPPSPVGLSPRAPPPVTTENPFNFLSTEFIIIISVSGVIVLVLIAVYIVNNPERAKACINLVERVFSSLRGRKTDGDGNTNTRDTINAVLDAAKRLRNESPMTKRESPSDTELTAPQADGTTEVPSKKSAVVGNPTAV